ncbi:MAG: hypothetical protein CO093_00060 [Alphaproteobacteria bacterium CG_4_9_14_3_um_filter_47_13]|nr:MAG: hypothetical protein CO093_00060 [Alphaproteobacteria bacterium CG_4_9_14_3_um_filter_47_13]
MRAVMIVCVILSFPLGIIGSVKISQSITANRALAATRAMTPEQETVRTAFSKNERKRYAAVLGKFVIGNPEKIYRLIDRDFLVMFHEPDLKRQDGETGIWQYRTESCVLDIYFGSAQQGLRPVIHYEVRPRQMAEFISVNSLPGYKIDNAACLQEIYRQQTIL